MTDGDIKKDILRFLAEVRKKEGPDKESDLTNFANEFGVDVDELSNHLAELYELFLINIHTFPIYLSISITNSGFEYITQSDDF